jgi:hypothetical protein
MSHGEYQHATTCRGSSQMSVTTQITANALISKLAKHWSTHQPPHINAGTTGGEHRKAPQPPPAVKTANGGPKTCSELAIVILHTLNRYRLEAVIYAIQSVETFFKIISQFLLTGKTKHAMTPSLNHIR